jgi:membrane fusion protein, multidrug efflux system
MLRHLPSFIVALMAASCAQETQQPATPVPQVGVELVTQSDLPLALQYSGHTAGSREVEVRARISGILLKRRYREGALVAQGSLLFDLDPEASRTAVEQASAEVAVQHAQATQAQRERERVQSVFDRGLVSQLQRDQAEAAAAIAAANLLAAQAKLKKAQLDLSYCEVRAPIAGLTSHEARSEGSLVIAGQESSLLTRIVQVDPLYVEFTVPESEAVLLRAALHGNVAVGAKLLLADGSEARHSGQLTFLDNEVETQSGAVVARASFPNPELLLIPGQFVRVRLDGMQLPAVIGVPRKAVLSGESRGGGKHFVWVVDSNSVASQRQVTLGAAVGELVVIKSGLAAGEHLVVDGVIKVADGKPVLYSQAVAAGDPLAAQAAATRATLSGN